jgi:hypothetical protein
MTDNVDRIQAMLSQPQREPDGKGPRVQTVAAWSAASQAWLDEVRTRYAPELYRRIIAETFQGLVLANPVGNKALWRRNAGKPPDRHQPRGYVGGTSRRSWRIDRGAPTQGQVPGLDPFVALSQITPNDRVYLTNPQPYIDPLNRGHSKQAPAGWIEGVFARVGAKYARVR